MMNLTVSLDNKFIVTAIKGLIPEQNLSISEYFNRIHNIPYDGVIAGPVMQRVAMERLSYPEHYMQKKKTAEKLAKHSAALTSTPVSVPIYTVWNTPWF